ncbi:triose-phosphate isomerase [Maritalea mediterranea]|uniref:Triosephosphate isomerase n=1 Tax=Maritalea mediterranea TaxID=2909667 RepID=A0ABS9E9T3_9HYPH|nr:triose-phosphate isomerase [Maritalea mediterranea]MCF4098535.1 triose-phosphate isomerase [Maritalea mediterranea]
MTEKNKKLIAGNWKMNGVQAALKEIEQIAAKVGDYADKGTFLICPPATLLAGARAVAGDALHIGAQDCHSATSGAFTGDISAQMIADLGGSFVIVGHSERREGHNESNEAVKAKAEAALEQGIKPIICCGETLEQREKGEAIGFVTQQIADSTPDRLSKDGEIAIAYEPIWAIGTGKTASADDVAEMHMALRKTLVDKFGDRGHTIEILYGGSVKPENANTLLHTQDVDGALVGGASLKAESFLGIVAAL